MAEDMYDDEGMEPNEPTADTKGKEMDGEDEGMPEATLPKSILMGKKFNVGDELVLKITGMQEDGITVAYAPSKKEGGGEGKDESEMASFYE